MGGMKFKQRGREEQAEADGIEEGTRVAKLCGTDCDELYKNLLKPRIKVGNEFVTQGRNKDQVTNSIGALCKGVFDRLFKWLVKKCNETLDTKQKRQQFIGVLDIAGFEIFDVSITDTGTLDYLTDGIITNIQRRTYLPSGTIHKDTIYTGTLLIMTTQIHILKFSVNAKNVSEWNGIKQKLLSFSTTVSSSFASTSPTRSCSSSLTITCSCWNKRRTPRKAFTGSLSISEWTCSLVSISLKRCIPELVARFSEEFFFLLWFH